MGRGLYTFNVSIMTAIVLVLLSGTGTALHFFKNARKFTWAHYILWSIGEVMLVAAFIAMYLCLMMRGEVPYFTVLLRSVGICYAVFLFPYVILALSYDIAAMPFMLKKSLFILLSFLDILFFSYSLSCFLFRFCLSMILSPEFHSKKWSAKIV